MRSLIFVLEKSDREVGRFHRRCGRHNTTLHVATSKSSRDSKVLDAYGISALCIAIVPSPYGHHFMADVARLR